MRILSSLLIVAALAFASHSLVAQGDSPLVDYPTPSAIQGKVDQIAELGPYQVLVDSLLLNLIRRQSKEMEGIDPFKKMDDQLQLDVEQYAGEEMANAFCKAVSLIDMDYFITEEVILAIREAGYDPLKQQQASLKILDNYMQGDQERLVSLAFAVSNASKLTPDNAPPGIDIAWSFEVEIGNICEVDHFKFTIAADLVRFYAASSEKAWLKDRLLAISLKLSSAVKPDFPEGINGYIDTAEESDLVVSYLQDFHKYFILVGDFLKDSEVIYEQANLICKLSALLDIRNFGQEAEKFRRGYGTEEKTIEAVMKFMNAYVDENPMRFSVTTVVLRAATPFTSSYVKRGQSWNSVPEVLEAFRELLKKGGCFDNLMEISNFSSLSVIYFNDKLTKEDGN